MKKNRAGQNRKSEKEYKRKRLFAMDEDYDEDYDEDEDDDDEEDEEDDEDDDEVEDDDDEEDYDDEEDEDDDDEEDDDEEDIDDDEEDESEWNSEEARRARRRTRRIRNQILAYLLIVIVIVGAIFGCFLGGRVVVQKIRENKQQKEVEDQLNSLQESEEDTVVDLNEGEGEEQAEEAALSPLDEIVTARIAEMPIEDKVAALFIVTPEQLTGVQTVTKAGDTTKEALTKYKVGGLVYTENNITGADQLKELLSNTALIDQTLFLAIEEEGGENSVLASKLTVTEVPDMASVSGVDGAHLAGDDTGVNLAEYGFNLNLAPVTDVKTSEESILGNRSFGSDPVQVGEMAAAYVTGLTERGISACVKTFPGLGGVTESTENGMADTQRSQSDMESAEFPAYQAAIAAGSEFVMVGTISAPGLTGGDNTPCCLSGAVVGLLRNQLGFNGIIITDALNETAITDYYTSADAAEKALKAGVDMIYMPENFTEAYEGILQAVQSGSLEESRIDESLLRIYRVKYKDRVDSALGDEGGDAEGVPGGEDAGAESMLEGENPGAEGEEVPAE